MTNKPHLPYVELTEEEIQEFKQIVKKVCRYPRLKPWHFNHITNPIVTGFDLNPVCLAKLHTV